MAKKKDDLKELMEEAKDLQGRLESVLSKAEKLKTAKAPEQAKKALKSIEAFAKLFRRGGAVANAYGEVQTDLRILQGYDPRYVEGLTSYERFDIPQTLETKYICETLLSAELHPKGDMWNVLSKVIQTRKVDGNSFMKGGE